MERGWNADHTEYSTNIGDVSTGSTTRVIEGHTINEFYLPNVYKGNGSYFNADGSVNINGGPKDGMIRTENDMKWLQAMVDAGYSFQPYNNIAQNALWYGEYIYADANGDGIYGNSYDSEFQGTSTAPKYNFGLYASANWKDFDFSMTWGGAAGFSVRQRMAMQYRMSWLKIIISLIRKILRIREPILLQNSLVWLICRGHKVRQVLLCIWKKEILLSLET